MRAPGGSGFKVKPGGYAAPQMTSSDRPDWRTPAKILDRVTKFAPIGLDPCAAPDVRHHFARTNIREPMDPTEGGLTAKWHGHGLVYVNPPYGKGIDKWMARCAGSQSWMDRKMHVIALVPARTDTRWFPWESLSAVCFVKGRLYFEGAPSPAPFPSAVIYWGNAILKFRSCFSDIGIVLER